MLAKFKSVRLWALGGLFAFTGCGAPPQVPAPPDTGPELEAIQVQKELAPPVRLAGVPSEGWTLRERMEHHAVPGVVVAAIDGGEIRFVDAWGLATAGTEDAVTEETLFQASSISKAVTATLVVRLAEEGLLDLDRDVEAGAWDGEPAGVTWRRLLAHTAGLGVQSFPGYAPDATLPTLRQILEGEAPATNLPVRRVLEPGAARHDSGGGYEVLEAAIETATGRDFADVMTEEILAPLEMTRTSFVHPLDAATAATGHDLAGAPMQGRWRVHPERAAAGLWTTAGDLARWVVDLQKAHAGKPGRRLRREGARTLFETSEPGEGAGGWGTGVMRGGSGQSSWFAHLGGNAGYPSLALGFVSSGHGAVVLTNGDGGAALVREIVGSLARVYDWPDFQPRIAVAIEPSAAALERLVGDYRVPALAEPGAAEGGAPLRVRVEDGAVVAEFLGRRSRLHAESETRFFELDEGWSFEVEDAETGAGLVVGLWPGYRFAAEPAVSEPAVSEPDR